MKGLIAFLLVLIVAGLGYQIYDREAQKRGGSLNLLSNGPSEPALNPVLLTQLQELYKTGNQFSQAIKTGVSLSNFSEYSVTLRAQIGSIQKLWPADYKPETQELFKKVDASLLVTEEAWQANIDGKRQTSGNSVEVTGSSHGFLLLKAMGLVDRNPYGLAMTFGDGKGGVMTSSDLLSGHAEILDDINHGRKLWLLSYRDLKGGEHSDIQMLLSLCDGYYGSLEGKILPLIK